MAVRLEKVVLDLEDRFTREMLAAGAATRALQNDLNSLSGTAVRTSRSVDQVERSVAKSGESTRRAGADIDRFSGRVKLLADVALMLGPAFIPITAVAIPAVTGLAAQLGFAALGAGSAIIAFQGLGDALSKMRAAELEPTAANLEAARQAMEQIGPHAQSFAEQLLSMGPALKAVRDAAAAGIFPGLTQALQEADSLLPRVASLFQAVGSAMGDLASDAAGSLAGPAWADFFAFLEREAPRALSELGHTLGDVAHGLAEMWMAFTPLNQDFTGWLRQAAADFDDWATGLEHTEGFQDFVDYIRDNGPKVADAMGSIGNALVQITQAAAPLGGPVLEAVASIADALAVLANSSLGTPLFTLAAGMAAVSRATSLLEKGSKGLSSFTSSFSGLVKGVGLFIGLDLAGAAINKIRDAAVGAAPDVERLTNAIQGLGDSSVGEVLGDDLKTVVDAARATSTGIGGLEAEFGKLAMSGPDAMDAVVSAFVPGAQMAGVEAEKVQQALESMDSAFVSLASTNGIGAAAGQFRDLADAQGLTTFEQRDLLAQMPEFTAALDAAGVSIASQATVTPRLANAMRQLAGDAGEAGTELDSAADSAQSFSDALAAMSGWLDQRSALRAWNDSIRELGKGLKDGFGRADAENIENVGRSFLQMATALEGKPGKQESFVDGAIKQLRSMAKDAGPKAQAQIRGLIAQMRAVGKVDLEPKLNTKQLEAKAAAAIRRMKALDALKANPKLDADDKAFQARFGLTRRDLAWLDGQKATAYLNAQDNASGTIGNVLSKLNSLDGTTAVTYIATRHLPTAQADGGVWVNGARALADGGVVDYTAMAAGGFGVRRELAPPALLPAGAPA